jgi:hypothetical protein
MAEAYAKAMQGEGYNPEILELGIQPQVRAFVPKFTSTIDNVKKLPSNAPVWGELVRGLPAPYSKEVLKSVRRNKTATYEGFLDKLESSMKRAGQSTSEENLAAAQAIVSENLRRLGVDSVLDRKSGFVLALDGKRMAPYPPLSRTLDQVADPMEAATARLNADAYTASKFKHRLTTDANLRDSAYKALSQTQAEIDTTLKRVQSDLIARTANDTRGVLEEVPAAVKPKKARGRKSSPKTAKDMVDEIESTLDDGCNL